MPTASTASGMMIQNRVMVCKRAVRGRPPPSPHLPSIHAFKPEDTPGGSATVDTERFVLNSQTIMTVTNEVPTSKAAINPRGTGGLPPALWTSTNTDLY